MIPLLTDERVIWLLHAERVIAYTLRHGRLSVAAEAEAITLRAALEELYPA